MSTSTIFLLAILALGFLITFQIAKASEYVSVLKGEEKAFAQNNRINGFLMVVFLVMGIIGIWFCHKLYYGKTLLPYPSASEHGEKIDTMLRITFLITGAVFFLTQILLFWFAYRYQHTDKKKAYYYPHNTKWEILWTTIPAIALSILVGFGLYYWFKLTGPAPKDAMEVEVTGSQFKWIFRYPGKDKIFGKKYFKNIDEANQNSLGLLWDDPAARDDIVTTEALYLVKGKPVKLILGSRDVLHDVGLSHFRVKMDAVPGIPTVLWFTPKYTTEEMQKIRKNPKFEYEISCQEMCGNGHYSMKGNLFVVTPSEFILWRAGQKPAYTLANPATPAQTPAGATDTTKKVTASKEISTTVARK